MTKNEHIEYWLETAEKDLIVATQLFDVKQYTWCLFISHLVVEKMLKANFVKNSNNLNPPKIHDLVKLANLSNVNLTDVKTELYYTINKFNIEARYPDYKQSIYKIATYEFTNDIFNKIQDEYKWLRSLTELST